MDAKAIDTKSALGGIGTNKPLHDARATSEQDLGCFGTV